MSQEAAKFPDWGKMQFHEYPEEHWGKLLPRVPEEGQDLVSELVRYESGARMTALKVSRNPCHTQARAYAFRFSNTLTFAIRSWRHTRTGDVKSNVDE